MNEVITFQVKGLKEMGEALAALPGKIARRALGQSVKAGAMIVRDAARPKAPIGTKSYTDWRGKRHRPGLLRKSGVVLKKLKTRNWQSEQLYGVGFSKLGWYGRFIEKGKSKKHQYAPHPFIVPTMEEKADEAISAIKNRLALELFQIANETGGITVTQ